MNLLSCFLPQRRTSSLTSPLSSKPSKRSTQPGLNWPFGLEQVRERVPPHTVSPRRFSQDEQTPTASCHGAALPVVDLDEVTHDLYRSSVFAAEAIEGHPGHIADALKDEEETFEDHSIDWFNHHHPSQTHLHAATSLGVNAAMVPLSALAIHAGLQETHHALKHVQTLKRRQTTLEAQRDRLSPLQHTPMHHVSRAECQVRDQLLSDLALDRQLTYADLGSGLSSTTAGSAILAKTSTEIGLSLGSKGALAGTGAEEAVHLSHLAAGAGFVSSMVLGPLASISAVSLGAFFLYQSKLEKGALKADIGRIQAFLASLDESTLCPRTQRYAEFLTEKLQQREQFISRYDGWNTAFATGSGAFAASTLTKTGLTAAAIAGSSAAAGPVGLGIIAGVGALGAAGMSVSSHQYFLYHNKHKRYRKYEYQDMPAIDRRFLVIADVLDPLPQAAHHPQAARSGFELRAALYAQVDGQEKALTQFLRQATQQLQKREIKKQRSTDLRQPIASTETSPRSGTKTKALLSAASAYGRQLLRGHPHRAHRDAKQAYAAQNKTLTPTSMAQWLEQPDSWPAQVDYMQTALELEQKYLTTKLATRQARQLISPPPPNGADASAQDRLIRTAQMDLIEHLRQAHAIDQDRLRTISTLIDDMHHLKNSSARLSPDLLTAWRTRFLKLQQAMEGEKARKPLTSFADFCLNTAYERTSAARGILLSVEKQAARLREQFQTRAPATVSAVDSPFVPPISAKTSTLTSRHRT